MNLHLINEEDENPTSWSREIRLHSDDLPISSGSLIRWTKGFSIDELMTKIFLSGISCCDGLNLTKAMHRKAIFKVQGKSLQSVSDTEWKFIIGTLAGGRYTHKDVSIAVILGTGTNAAYVERAQ
ncbi:hypothetical protein Leryth_003121 [Lithospermum erythrorhizon]|nr:hypothetical protein Leryth_003121 [Lithospermum erythrorhizon]